MCEQYYKTVLVQGMEMTLKLSMLIYDFVVNKKHVYTLLKIEPNKSKNIPLTRGTQGFVIFFVVSRTSCSTNSRVDANMASLQWDERPNCCHYLQFILETMNSLLSFALPWSYYNYYYYYDYYYYDYYYHYYYYYYSKRY